MIRGLPKQLKFGKMFLAVIDAESWWRPESQIGIKVIAGGMMVIIKSKEAIMEVEEWEGILMAVGSIAEWNWFKEEGWRMDMKQVELRLKDCTCGWSCLHMQDFGPVLKLGMGHWVTYRLENAHPWCLIILAFHVSFQKSFVKLKALAWTLF